MHKENMGDFSDVLVVFFELLSLSFFSEREKASINIDYFF